MGFRVAVVVNPTAGHGRTGKLWPAVARAFAEQGLVCDASFTAGPGDATRLAAAAMRSGYELVVSVGGDGTLNEVVNGLLADGAPSASGVRLAVISSGTGCDLVRSLGIPPGVAGASALTSGHERLIDVGLVTYQTAGGDRGSRYFVNAADLGIGADVARRVNAGGRRLGGFLSFFVGTLAGIAAAEFQPVTYTLDDASPVTTTAGVFFAANGRYAGHAMMFAPLAELDDGLLDVVILTAMPKLELLFDLFPKVYRGAHVGHRKVLYAKAARLTVTSPRPLPLEIDGELPGQAPVEIAVLPRVLRVAVPDSGQ